MKKLLALFFTLPIIWWAINLKWCYPKKFIVSGYYSPKPNQKFYHKWSYRAEIRLNGKGFYTASHKKVFNGVIAAPKNYKFWTKIYFPWYGVWIVEDRWWAIVKAWKRWNRYDRIDIWMWRWEQWLIRSLSFGKKVIVWYVCPPTKKLKIWFNRDNFPIYKNNFFEVTLWWIWLSKGRKDPWVKTLQKYLAILWFFPKKLTTWYFWPITKKSLCKYQLKYKLVKSKYDPWCWYFWPKTRQFMKKQLIKLWIIPKNLYKTYIIPSRLKNKTKKQNKNEIISNLKLTLNRWFLLWEKNEKVKILQTYLKKLGFYKWPVNGIYDSKTAEAVYKFQIKYWIIKWNENIKVLWYFWPKTRKVFFRVLEQNL